MSRGYEKELRENRQLWEEWTPVNVGSAFYDAQRFRADPTDVRIADWQQAEVGDVTGKTLLHLQCHFGLDTLSWLRLGAARVTGVDFSPAAIAAARQLAAQVGLSERARFVESNIYDLPGPLAGERFDVVYTGCGALGWLPDLAPWARLVADFVAPGGIFYVHEGHPALWAIADEQRTPNDLHLAYDYWGDGKTLSTPVQGSYADPSAQIEATVQHGWNHSIGEVVTLLARNGLRIELLDEKREVDWPMPFLVATGEGTQHAWPKEQVGTLPLMYSLRARKDGGR
jgi:SAM-dependent methyltransferase